MTVAIIPARSGSERVPSKNIRLLLNHPLIAYTISLAIDSGIFSKVICSTDSEEIGEIARYYGCHDIIWRPEGISGSKSPDIFWINHAISTGKIDSDYFGILRITSPIKLLSSLIEALDFSVSNQIDSIRAVTPVRDHPGKVWVLSEKPAGKLTPLLHNQVGEIAFHARQYQDLPEMFVQTSSFEFIRTESVLSTKTREGTKVFGYLTKYPETITIDYEDEFDYIKFLVTEGKICLPKVDKSPFSSSRK